MPGEENDQKSSLSNSSSTKYDGVREGREGNLLKQFLD